MVNINNELRGERQCQKESKWKGTPFPDTSEVRGRRQLMARDETYEVDDVPNVGSAGP